MANPSQLVNLELEQTLIALLLQKPELYGDISQIVRGQDLQVMTGRIYELIKQTIENKGTPTPIVLAEKCKSLGVHFDGVEVIDFLSALLIRPVDGKGAKEVAKEIRRLSFARTLFDNGRKIQEEIIKNKNSKASELMAIADKYLGNSISLIESEDDGAVNLDEGMADLIDELGNNPVEVKGYKTPFPIFDGYFSCLEPAAVSQIAARTGAGKSTFLMYLLDQVVNVCNPDRDIKGLYIDTELNEDKQRLRLAASRIGCPYYLIKTGLYRKDPIWAPKIQAETKKMRENPKTNMFFKQGHNLTGDDFKNFVKKWYFKHCGRNGDAFIIWDYLKPLAVDMMKGSQPEWQVIYHKMQMLKDLAIELNIPIFTAIQLNASATTKGKKMGEMDDSEAGLSMSKRLDWLLDFSGILRRKLPDEIEYHGAQYGTHMLIPHKGREQGANGTGHHNLVKVFDKKEKKSRYEDNFLCYNIDNFRVEEVGDFRKIAQENGWSKIPLEKKSEEAFI